MTTPKNEWLVVMRPYAMTAHAFRLDSLESLCGLVRNDAGLGPAHELDRRCTFCCRKLKNED